MAQRVKGLALPHCGVGHSYDTGSIPDLATSTCLKCVRVCVCVCTRAHTHTEILKELDCVYMSNPTVFQPQIPIDKQAKLAHVFTSKLQFKIRKESEIFLKNVKKKLFSSSVQS